MASGHSTTLSRRSKLSELIRSPFRSSTLPQEDNDWYIPYNGPIEPPPLSLPSTSISPPFDYLTSQRRERSSITPEAHRDSRIFGHLRDSSPSKRGATHKARKPARQAVISLDTGGIGESPATVLDEQSSSSRRSSSAAANLFSSSILHKDRSPPPPAIPYVVNTPSSSTVSAAAVRHPFNPHHYTFHHPTTTTSGASPTLVPTTVPVPTFSSSHPTTDKHPYVANTFSRPEQVLPATITSINTASTSRSRAATVLSNATASDRSAATSPFTSDHRNPLEWSQQQHLETTPRHRHGRVEQHFTGSSSGSTSATSHHSSQHHTLIKSRSTPQSLSASQYNYLNTTAPAYSMQTHPYALSPIPSSLSPTSLSGMPLGYNGKPPIPRKSPGVLQRLRATASAPNLQNGTKQGSHSQLKNLAYPREHKRSHVPPRIDITPPTTGLVHDGMAHEFPVTLAPVSSVQAVVYPRPRFVASLLPPEDPIPDSPYPLSRPLLPEFDDTDRNMFAQCLPLPAPNSYKERVREVKEAKGSTPSSGVAELPPSDAASFKSKDVEKTLDLHRGGPRDHEDDISEDEVDEEEQRAEVRRRRERDEALAQAVRDGELLKVERERWEKRAQRSLGNKRSRSLSMRGRQQSVRRSVSHGALESIASTKADSGRTPSSRHRAMTVTSGDGNAISSTHTRTGSSKGVSGLPPTRSARSRSTTLDSAIGPSPSVSSLRYLASAAFGHTGHSAKAFADGHSGSGGRTSLLSPTVEPAAGAAGLMSSRRSATSGSRSGSLSGSHSRGSSADTRQIAVATVVRLSQAQQQDADSDVMDIRDNEDNSVRVAVEQRIGLALSPSPELMLRSRSNTALSASSSGVMQHPYASPSVISTSLSSRAGPHPTTASQTSNLPFKDDVATRHRLPPQVLHAHKRSLSTGHSGSSAVPVAALASPSPARIAKSSAPPSTDISGHPFMAPPEISLERPNSGRVEESFQEALIAGTTSTEWLPRISAELRDGDPFRANPVAIVPTTPPSTPRRGRTRSNGSASPSTTPRLVRRQPSALSSLRNQQRPFTSPVATSTPLKRRSRSMSDIRPPIFGHSTSSKRTGSRPVSPSCTFGARDSLSTSQVHPRPSLENRVSQTSGISPPTESSVVSIVNPEIRLHEGRDDLEEFRDLFYRPNMDMAYSADSSPRESLRVDTSLRGSVGVGGRPISGTSALWSSIGPVFGEHFEMEPDNLLRPPIRSSEHQLSVQLYGSPDPSSRSQPAPENGEFIVRIPCGFCLLKLSLK